MHPGILLVGWSVLVVLIQQLEGMPLHIVGAALLAMCLALARMRTYRLLRRARWLLLAVAVLFAWQSPGAPAIQALGGLSPSLEGLKLAGDHGVHLIVVVGLVALLLERCARDRLVSGIHALLWPAKWFGLERTRVAIRLLLVLRYAEQGGAGRSWRDWLGVAPEPTDEGAIVFARHRFGWSDAAMALFLSGAVVLTMVP